MRLMVIVGARPNFVKVGPLLPELENAGHDVSVAFTGSRKGKRQENGEGRMTFYGVAVPTPEWFLDVGAGTEGVQTGEALIALEALLAEQMPEAVMVVGDVNTTLAAAIAAAKLHIPIVHLEAGLRCGSMCISEEVNRILISRMTSLHLAPTERAVLNLTGECIPAERIRFVGNMMAESVLKHLDQIKRLDAASVFGLEKGKYVLASFHNSENMRAPRRLQGIMEAISHIDIPVLIPDAEGLRQALAENGISVSENAFVVDAVGYLEMLALERDADVVLTDSGGVQEEACMVGTPCVTVRSITEHTATIEAGANRLAEPTTDSVLAAIDEARENRTWLAPKRWDRAVSGRIVRELRAGVDPLF